MKTLFKIAFMLLLSIQLLTSQNLYNVEMDEIHTIYKESFSTDEETVLVLNLKNTRAQVDKSPDDKVHISYTMEFKNYRKKDVEFHKNRTVVEGKKQDNKIVYSSIGKKYSHHTFYELEDMLAKSLRKGVETKEGDKTVYFSANKETTKNTIRRKSLDSVLNQINETDIERLNRFFGKIKIKPNKVKKWKRGDKLYISKMLIQIPENIHVRVTLENSKLRFDNDFTNRATVNSRNSRLKFKTVGNPLNVFDIDNGSFTAVEVTSGSYGFANSRYITMGFVKNSLINSEFTKVEIGEVGENNKIVDFNSKYYLYNFADNFKKFKITSEYSTLYFFEPKQPFKLITKGYDSAFFHDDIETVIRPSKEKKFNKMLVVGEDLDDSVNTIDIQLVHGVMAIGKDNLSISK